MKKIITVVGARPQFVKAAVVSRLFGKENGLKEVVIHTGQHFDENMSDVFFQEMEIPRPDYNLNINGLGHGAMTGQMLIGIEEVLLSEKPDWVLVYGDTNSTLAGALAARKLGIKVAHVEAGLRSFNMVMPEEINRILTDRISDLLFCPTDQAVNNLRMEGFDHFPCRVVKNGDVMQDAALFYSSRSRKHEFDLPDKVVLCTVHRAENTDNPEVLRNIFSALETISRDVPIVLPLHPRTKIKLQTLNYDLKESSIIFIDPVGYLEMVYLLDQCALVMTDSGGLQKEAYFFRKPCVTLREETEWVELVENGYNIIAGTTPHNIIQATNEMLDKPSLDFSTRLYGNGDAGERIIEELLKY